MKNILVEKIRLLVNSNIWIALATVCFYELTLLQIGVELEINASVIFLFFATLFIYNFFRILGNAKGNKLWYVKNYNYTKTLSILAFIASGISFYYFDKEFIGVISLAGLLTFVYVSPFSFSRKMLNFRRFWFLKSIIVALVWVLLTVLLPLLENQVYSSNYWFFVFEKFLFILGISIPYDIKDLAEDESSGVKTVAIKFGIKCTKWISNSILCIGLILAFFIEQHFFTAVFLVYLSAIFLNQKLAENKNELWYTFLVDGTIILYFTVVWLQSNL